MDLLETTFGQNVDHTWHFHRTAIATYRNDPGSIQETTWWAHQDSRMKQGGDESHRRRNSKHESGQAWLCDTRKKQDIKPLM
jgi:hypothetical protein